jgi:AbiV family abortive infection protein
MSSKTFLTISREECLVVYKNVLANSDCKWEASERIAEAGEYGTATSLAIISVEEMVKALVLLIDGKGFQFRSVRGMDSLFYHHQIRYFIAYAMFLMGIFRDELFRFLKRHHADDNYISGLYGEWQNDQEKMLRKIKFYAFRKFIQVRREFVWFSKIDLFRQDGFYSDYEDQLKNPMSISIEDYQKLYDRLKTVREVGLEIFETLNDQDEQTAERLGELKKQFREKDYYKKISDSLTTIRQKRQSPFEMIKEHLE